MKATKVRNLDPRGPLRDNASRIVATRLAELRSFAPQALGPDGGTAQHDMRIAAKRLRYVLETVGFCFGDIGDTGRRAARDLQGVLGDVHDCDVLIETVEHYTSVPGTPATDRGLEQLVARTVERRDQLEMDFRALWARLVRDGVWDRLASAAATAP